MKRIGNSKEPTPARMSAVAENLMKHLGCYVSVKVEANSHDHIEKTKLTYGVYISNRRIGHNEFDSWPRLLKFYRKNMEDLPNV